MKYLKIENPGRLDRLAIRYDGFTTKRDAIDDENVIGKNGSGTKYAPLSAYRSGLGFAISSTDEQGQYLLTYEDQDVMIAGQAEREVIFHTLCIDPEDGIPYTVRENPRRLMSAFLEWDKPIGSDDNPAFKPFREFLCNARDEGGGLHLQKVDAPHFAEDGQVAVYLRLTDDLWRMISGDMVPRYFKFIGNQKPIVRYRDLGAIHYKSDPENTRLFALGVLVGCYSRTSLSSIFDYSLSDKNVVSEERLIKNYWAYVDGVAKLLSRVVNEKVTTRIVKAVAEGRAEFEESVLGRIGSFSVPLAKTAWLNAVHEVYGSRIAIASDKLQLDNDCEQIFGYKTFKPRSADIRRFLRTLGIPKVEEIVPNAETFDFEQIPFHEIDGESRKRFQKAFAVFSQTFPDRASIPVAFFHPLSEAMRKYAAVAGFGHAKCEEIWIATVSRTALPSVASMCESLAHESRHCVTRAGDYDRRFIDQADRDALTDAYRRHGITQYDDGSPVVIAGSTSVSRPVFAPMLSREFVLEDGNQDILVIDEEDP